MIKDPKGKIYILEWEEAHELLELLHYEDWLRLIESRDEFLRNRYGGKGDQKFTYWNLQNAISRNEQGKRGEAILLGFFRKYFPEVDWRFPIPGTVYRGDGGDIRVYPKCPDMAIADVDENVIGIPEAKSWKNNYVTQKLTVEDLYASSHNHLSVILHTWAANHPVVGRRGRPRVNEPLNLYGRHIFGITFYPVVSQVVIQGTISGEDFCSHGINREYKEGQWAKRVRIDNENVIPIPSFVSALRIKGEGKIEEMKLHAVPC